MKHLCWSCANVFKKKCPKYNDNKPNGYKEFKHDFPNENYIGIKVLSCPNHIYDGECIGCIRNVSNKNKCLYNECKYYKKNMEGYCASENWKEYIKTKNEMEI